MNLATRIGEEFNLVRDEGMVRLNALAPYNGIIGTDTKQQQENLVFSTTVGNEYKLVDNTRFRKIDGKVIDTYGPELVTNGDFSNGTTGWNFSPYWYIESNKLRYVGGGISTAAFGCNLATTIGKRYLITMDLTEVTSYWVGIFINGVLIDDTYGKTNLPEKVEVYFSAESTTSLLSLNARGGVIDAYFDNISVREVQTIDFSRSGQHPFEVYTNTTLTAPNNVLAGDYVVFENPELVTNGTFDTDVSGWTADGGALLSHDKGRLKIVGSGAENPRAFVNLNSNYGLVDGQTYLASASIETDGVPARLMVYHNGTSINPRNLTTDGISVFSFTYTMGSPITVIATIDEANSNSIVYFDNISVKLADDTYRATRDSSKMYDYTTNDGIITIKIGDIVKLQDGYSKGGVTNGFYKRVSSIGSTDLSTWNYTNTSYWEYLGTAENMSLQNPYFQKRNYISNQVLAMQKADGTIHTETLFKDAYAVETTNAVLIKNGWSKLENGLYSKGTVIGSPVGYWQTLNKGAYHPVYNAFGTRTTYGNSGREFWHTELTKEYISAKFIIADTAGNASTISGYLSSSNNGRPDSKFYNIVYTDQFRDLRTNAEKANIPQLLNEVHNGAVNGSLGGYSDAVGMVNLKQQSNSGSSTNLTFFKEEYPTWKEDFIRNNPYVYHNGEFGKSVSVTEASSTMFFVTLNTSITRVLGADTFVVTKLPITSYKTSLTTDVIGSPINYPTMMKDRLVSGKPLVGLNPLLVGQDGTSYINSDLLIYTMSKKASLILPSVYTDSTKLYNSFTSNVNYVTNTDITRTSSVFNGRITISNYTSSNPVANISTPKAVQQVGNYAVATNSHSIYRGANLTQLIGRVGVGSSLESKVLEDVLHQGGVPDNTYINGKLISKTIYPDVPVTVFDSLYYLCVGFGNGVPVIIRRHGGGSFTLLSSYVWVTSSFNTVIESVPLATPTHNTITLDNSYSPAIKTLSTIATADDGELLYQVFGEEIVGTGDTGSFSQLTNGTKIDWNGTTVKTVCATIGTGVYE